MELQVKVTLGCEADKLKLRDSLQSRKVEEIQQENHFFDGVGKELESHKGVFRLRLTQDKCEASLKERAALEEGSTLRWAEVVTIPLEQGRTAVQNPDNILHWKGHLFEELKTDYGITSLKHLGGFQNTREVFQWEDGLLALDTTSFPNGMVYELEVSKFSSPVSDVMASVEQMLSSLGIAHQPSKQSKFDHFIHDQEMRAQC